MGDSLPREPGSRHDLAGTIEGFAAIFLTMAALALPVGPGNQELMTIVLAVLIGLGLGLGIGGIRFGNGAGRACAWSAVVILTALVIALAARDLWLWFAPILR